MDNEELTYQPGDIVNGHILGSDMKWYLVENPHNTVGEENFTEPLVNMNQNPNSGLAENDSAAFGKPEPINMQYSRDPLVGRRNWSSQQETLDAEISGVEGSPSDTFALRDPTDPDEMLGTIENMYTYYGLSSEKAFNKFGINLPKSERLFFENPNVELIELQRQKGYYRAGHSGFRIRATKRLSFNVGGSRGSYVPGEQQLTTIDVGNIYVTNKRIIFTGNGFTREWLLKNLNNLEFPENNLVMLPVTNRQKVSGVNLESYDATKTFFFLIHLAISDMHGSREEFLKRFE